MGASAPKPEHSPRLPLGFVVRLTGDRRMNPRAFLTHSNH